MDLKNEEPELLIRKIISNCKPENGIFSALAK